jgi:hypothetical protein
MAHTLSKLAQTQSVVFIANSTRRVKQVIGSKYQYYCT